MNLDKKYIFIGASILAIAVIGFMAYFAFRTTSPTPSNQIVNTTPMDKLLASKAISSHDGIYVLVNEPDYFLAFDTPHQEFQIQLLPAEQTVELTNQIRETAESKLLEFSGLTKETVCKYNVVESIHYSYWAEKSGVNYGFSSCPTGIIFK